MPLEIHLVAHTHWDREWYHPAEVFRLALVDLVDELIDSPPRGGESFLLDGQTIVLEDYLTVRPERRDRLASVIQSGRLEAGPWYVLADELIPGAEALIRNLLIGRYDLTALGTDAPPILYCPDSFGHPAALPELAAGFGIPLIILWRGYGSRRWPSGDVVRWRAPSGAESLLYHLPRAGYELGSSLPIDSVPAKTRWDQLRSILAPRSTVGVALLQNGADHHARQRDQADAVKMLQSLAEQSGDRVHASSMRGFAEALTTRAAAQRLPLVAGELRDSHGYTWTLQGTFGTRAAQKRSSAVAERALVRGAEPWSALAWLNGAPSRAHYLRAAWKTLLQAHPHDTLCGTSIDAVAAAMDQRLASALAQAAVLVSSAVDHLLGHDRESAREKTAEWKSFLIVRNDSAAARSGVAIVELIEKVADEPVGPGSEGGPDLERIRTEGLETPAIPKGAQLLDSRIERHRVESATHYPDNDIVRVSTVAVVVDAVAAFGLLALDPLEEIARPPSGRVRVSKNEMSNALVRCGFEGSGAVVLEGSGLSSGRVVQFEDLVDNGDLYTPSLRGPAATASLDKLKVVHKGPLIGEVNHRWSLSAPGEKRRAGHGVVDVALRMVADSPLLEVVVTGLNQATNHRLRLGIGTGVASATVVADAAFGPVERVPLALNAEEAATEQAPRTAPLHRYVSLFTGLTGATVFSDGLAEYEVDAAGTVWITLVRAVGELSRNNLPERPGHAGWPVATPGAQCLGTFEGRFALLLHAGRTAPVIDQIEREADRFLNPLRGFTLRSAIATPKSFKGPELSGVGLAFSAMKQSEDGEWLVLRCVNLTDRDQSGRWTLANPIREARLARLDETPGETISVSGAAPAQCAVEFIAGPRAAVTILVR